MEKWMDRRFGKTGVYRGTLTNDCSGIMSNICPYWSIILHWVLHRWYKGN